MRLCARKYFQVPLTLNFRRLILKCSLRKARAGVSLYMVWSCIHTPLGIRVNSDLKFKGYYFFLESPFCEKCGSPRVKTEDCSLHELVYGFDRVYPIGEYTKEGPPYPLLSSHIRLLKDHNRIDLAIPLGYALNTFIECKYPTLSEADYFVPVPAHQKKIMERGYNQVELIVERLCEKNPIPSLLCLEQVKYLELRKHGLNNRYEEVKGAFEFNTLYEDKVHDSHIILVDDVVTSCATSSECASILKDNGARKVDVLTCGRNRLD